MLKPYLEKLLQGKHLDKTEMTRAVDHMLGDANPYQTAAFLSLIKAKGETSQELLGAIKALQQRMTPIFASGSVLDIVGTGGDGQRTVNISTGAAIVAASCGAKVAKHGNRSASSKCGSADVLEQLGVDISMGPNQVVYCMEEVGIAFMFAPLFHPAMKAVAPIRKGMGISTLFNIIGPLLNPAGAQRLLVGVYDEALLEPFAEVLCEQGVERALVVHNGGLDELSCLGSSKVKEVSPSGVREYTIDPEALGLERCTLDDLRGGDAAENAQMLCHALKGGKSPITPTLALNAGAGLYVYGLVNTLAEGVALAQEHLQEGKPFGILERWRALC